MALGQWKPHPSSHVNVLLHEVVDDVSGNFIATLESVLMPPPVGPPSKKQRGSQPTQPTQAEEEECREATEDVRVHGQVDDGSQPTAQTPTDAIFFVEGFRSLDEGKGNPRDTGGAASSGSPSKMPDPEDNLGSLTMKAEEQKPEVNYHPKRTPEAEAAAEALGRNNRWKKTEGGSEPKEAASQQWVHERSRWQKKTGRSNAEKRNTVDNESSPAAREAEVAGAPSNAEIKSNPVSVSETIPGTTAVDLETSDEDAPIVKSEGKLDRASSPVPQPAGPHGSQLPGTSLYAGSQPTCHVDMAKVGSIAQTRVAELKNELPKGCSELVDQIYELEKELVVEMDAIFSDLAPVLSEERTQSVAIERAHSSAVGLDVQRQRFRRTLKAQTIVKGSVMQFKTRIAHSTKQHADRLMQLAESQGLAREEFMRAFPLATFSKEALDDYEAENGGSQPTVNYTQLLAHEGTITLPSGFKGRKANAACIESPLCYWEHFGCYPWLAWWLELGAWSSFDEVDAAGWTPLMHAADAITYCSRAVQVTKDALLVLSPSTLMITAKSTGSQPTGWTALHFACDGSDRDFQKAEIVAKLLEARADVNSREAKGNTPLLVAAGSGLTDVCEVLIFGGADREAINDRLAGAVERAEGCSPSLATYLRSRGVPDTDSRSSGRTRTGVSDNRAARYALTTSTTSRFTSHAYIAGGNKGAGEDKGQCKGDVKGKDKGQDKGKGEGKR